MSTPKGRTRQRAIHVCLSAVEFSKLYELAEEDGISLSTWVRLQIREEHAELVRRKRAELARGEEGGG
jgi:hypothetical protein